MQIVIDISEKDYKSVKQGHIPFSVLDVLRNGKLLSNTDKEQKEKFELGFKQGQQFGRQATLDEIRAEIEKQEKSLIDAGHDAYDVDMTIKAMRSIVAKSEVKE